MIDMHVHTTESDGRNSFQQISDLCRKTGVKKIGITDHWKTKRYSPDFYVADIDTYAGHCKKFKEEMKQSGVDVYIGLEVDFTKKYGYEISGADINDFNKLDFILFEYVNTKEETWGVIDGKPIESLFELRDRLDVPTGLAHNDFYFNFKDNFDAVIKEMSARNIFLELCEGEESGKKKVDESSLRKLLALKKNMSGLDIYKGKKPITRKKHMRGGLFYFESFPEQLWEAVKKYKLPLSVSTDNHSGTGLGSHPRADRLLKKYDLFSQLIFDAGLEYETALSR